MSANLIIGSSHALCLARRLGKVNASSWQEASLDVLSIDADTQLLFATNRPSFLELTRDAQGRIGATFGPLMEKVRAFNREDAKVVLSLGGNEHNIRFLQAAPKPFDFYHPSYPPTDPTRQILPTREMRAVLASLLERTLVVTRLIAAELPKARRFYLPPPPPIPSEDHIRKSPEIFDFSACGVEDAGVRLKIYNLYIEKVSAFCQANGLEFIAPVAENRDRDGFLREPFWEGNTHANADYYRAVVAEIAL